MSWERRVQTLSVQLTSSESIQPFHLAFPVHDLQLAREFYGQVLGCPEGRSSARWVDYNLFGHQIVCHLVHPEYRAIDYFNPVDKDDVPVHHFGVALTVQQFHDLKDRLVKHDVKFQIEPTLRFKGQPGEQYTMFFRDPSGNALEFKAMTTPENLFAKRRNVNVSRQVADEFWLMSFDMWRVEILSLPPVAEEKRRVDGGLYATKLHLVDVTCYVTRT